MPNIPNVPIEKVNKMPLAFALMIVGILLGFFVNKYIASNNNEVTSLRTENVNCNNEVQFWRDKYVGSLERISAQKAKQDSLNEATHVKLSEPNKTLLKAIKKAKQ